MLKTIQKKKINRNDLAAFKKQVTVKSFRDLQFFDNVNKGCAEESAQEYSGLSEQGNWGLCSMYQSFLLYGVENVVSLDHAKVEGLGSIQQHVEDVLVLHGRDIREMVEDAVRIAELGFHYYLQTKTDRITLKIGIN